MVVYYYSYVVRLKQEQKQEQNIQERFKDLPFHIMTDKFGMNIQLKKSLVYFTPYILNRADLLDTTKRTESNLQGIFKSETLKRNKKKFSYSAHLYL